MAFTPDGRSVVTTGDDGKVLVWDAQTAAPTETLSGHEGRVLGLTVSRDGGTVYTCGLDGAVFVWDLGSTQRFGRPFSTAPRDVQVPEGLPEPMLAVSPDSSRFAVRTGVGEVGVFSVKTLRVERSFSLGKGTDARAVVWEPGGRLDVAQDGQDVQVWDVQGATPRRVTTLTGLQGTVQALALSPDGRRLAATTFVPPAQGDPNGRPDGWLGVWDLRSGRLLTTHHLGVDAASVAYAPDGASVAAGLGDGRVLVVSSTGSVRRTLDLSAISSGAVTALAFRRDGTLLTGTWSGIVQHWRVSTGRQLGHPVLVEPAPVASIAVAPDSSAFAVSGGSSGGVKIWDDASLQQFGATFPGGASTWGHVTYTPDGSSVVVVYDNGTAAVWPTTLSSWLDHACAVAGRNLTHEEWSRFVPGHSYARTCPQFPAR
jgi:WD40 repeat protein